MVAPHVQQLTSRRESRPPRFFAQMAPGWALYAFAVLFLSAITGLAGWLAQRGIRLIWGILVALGAGAQVAGLALLWQRAAWRSRVRRAGADAAPELLPALNRTETCAGRAARGLALVGLILFIGGIIGIFRTQGNPTQG